MRRVILLLALALPLSVSAQDWPGVAIPTGTCGGDLGGTFPDCTVDDDASDITRLTQAATEVDVIYDTTNNRYCYSTDDDTTCDDQEQIVNPRHVLNVEEFLAGGTDYGAALTSAYAYLRSTLSPTNTGGVIEIPRGDTRNFDSVADFCDETGGATDASGYAPDLAAITVIGRGANLAGQNGTRFVATATLALASARTGTTTLSLTQDDSPTLSYDTITRAAGSFITDGFKHGDLVTINGFSATLDSDEDTAFVDPAKIYVVYSVSELTMVMQGVQGTDAGLTVVAGGGDESVTELTEMLRTCTRKAIFKDFSLDGARLVDLGVHVDSDNAVAQACTAASAPYAACTGLGTASGLSNKTEQGQRFENLEIEDALIANAVVRSATNTMGQADRIVFENVRLIGAESTANTAINLWVDNLQAKPAVVVTDSDLNDPGFANIWVTGGGVNVTRSNFTQGTTASDDCRDGNFAGSVAGTCYAILVGNAALGMPNVNYSALSYNAFDIYESNGIVFSATGGSDTDQISLTMIGNTVNCVTCTAAYSLLTYDNEGGLFVDPTNLFCRQSGATTQPTITLANDDEATRPLQMDWRGRVDACAGGAVAITVNDSVVNGAGRVYQHATDCSAVPAGSINGDMCWERDANTMYMNEVGTMVLLP
jgi:hypothetical protein